MSELTQYEKAGRVFRLLAWIQMIVFAVIAIPIFAGGKVPPASSLRALLMLLLFMFLYFKVGKAIKEHKEWGRTVGIIMGILMLFGFPIGTLIGAYAVWCLVNGWDEKPRVCPQLSQQQQLMNQLPQMSYNDKFGRFLLAVRTGDVETVKILVDADPSLVQAIDPDRRTPLHIATDEGRIEVAQYLLSCGADVNILDNIGESPLSRARFLHNERLVQLFVTNGGIG